MRLAARVDRTTERTGDLHILLAVSSIAAGVIHAAVVPEHLEEEWIFGVFFIAVAGFQTGWAIRVLFRPSAILYEIGALANGALIGIWVVSRTVGLPIGSDAWMPERVGTADITATLLELLLFVGSLVLVRRPVHAEGYGVGRDTRSPRPRRERSAGGNMEQRLRRRSPDDRPGPASELIGALAPQDTPSTRTP